MRWMDRWAARAQRKSDARQARWLERQRERASSGQMTAADRWPARLQRGSDERAARWEHRRQLHELIPFGPVAGPDGSTAVISVGQTGLRWLRWASVLPRDYGGTVRALVPVSGIATLVSLAVWRWVFRRAYTVYVRTDNPKVKLSIRAPDQDAAYHTAAQLVSRFQAGGPAALADRSGPRATGRRPMAG